MREYQRERIAGWTTGELFDLDSLAALGNEVVKNDLEELVHPIWGRERWFKESEMPKHRGCVPIWGDEPGFWTVC